MHNVSPDFVVWVCVASSKFRFSCAGRKIKIKRERKKRKRKQKARSEQEKEKIIFLMALFLTGRLIVY